MIECSVRETKVKIVPMFNTLVQTNYRKLIISIINSTPMIKRTNFLTKLSNLRVFLPIRYLAEKVYQKWRHNQDKYSES